MNRRAACLTVLSGLLLLASPMLRASGDTEYVDSAYSSIDPSKLRLTFDEPFDSLDVSAWGPGTRWIAHTPWNGDFGGAAFSDPEPGFPFTVSRGELTIEASRDAEGKWRSGLLASADSDGNGFSQKYGYFEMRARLPKGPGLWPAFWLIGIDRSKYTAETDVIEYRGDKPDGYSSTVHVWFRDGRHYSDYKRVDAFRDGDPADYHTYGVSVTEDFTRMYFDRELVWETPTPVEHRQPRYILLNLALVDEVEKESAPDPSFMVVDHVRVWAFD